MIKSSSFRHLDLKYNAIDYFNARYHLQGIKMIGKLYLNRNDLNDESLNFSSSDNLALLNLKKLGLGNNELQMMPLFKITPYLKEIDLDRNYLTGFSEQQYFSPSTTTKKIVSGNECHTLCALVLIVGTILCTEESKS